MNKREYARREGWTDNGGEGIINVSLSGHRKEQKGLYIVVFFK